MQENFANVPAHKQIVPGHARIQNIFLFHEKKRSLMADGPECLYMNEVGGVDRGFEIVLGCHYKY